MKLKNIFILSSLVTIALVTSCKKTNDTIDNGKASVDNRNIQAGVDGMVADANAAIANESSINGRTGKATAIDPPCGSTVDTTKRRQGILTINYNGTTNCSGYKRAGSIKLTLQGFSTGTRWITKGAVLQIDYTAYKITRLADGASLTFNGTHYLTNVEGGYWGDLLFGIKNSLVFTVTGTNLKVTFDDGKEALWNVARKYTYTFANFVLTLTGEGFGSVNGLTQIESWGTTKEGFPFTCQVVEPVVVNSTCGGNSPIKGKWQFVLGDYELTTVFGVDKNGNVQSSGCAYGSKVTWRYKNKNGSKIYPYN